VKLRQLFAGSQIADTGSIVKETFFAKSACPSPASAWSVRRGTTPLRLQPGGFAISTTWRWHWRRCGGRVRSAADRNGGGCFAILEGGYNHQVLGQNVLALIQGMAREWSCCCKTESSRLLLISADDIAKLSMEDKSDGKTVTRQPMQWRQRWLSNARTRAWDWAGFQGQTVIQKA